MQYLDHSFIPEYKFGYFSTTSYCIPKLFPDIDDSSYDFTAFLTALNLLLIFVVLVSYLIIPWWVYRL